MDDKTLWRQFRDGNHHVFETIYKRHVNLLANYGRRISSDDELVKDAIHDVFTSLWKNRSNLGATDTIQYYLIKALRRNLFNKMQKARKLVFREVHEDFDLSPEEVLIESEFQQERVIELHEKLSKLSSRQKEAIFLRFYSGLEYSSISRIMGINPQSAYNIVFRALETLRKDLVLYLTVAIDVFSQ